MTRRVALRGTEEVVSLPLVFDLGRRRVTPASVDSNSRSPERAFGDRRDEVAQETDSEGQICDQDILLVD